MSTTAAQAAANQANAQHSTGPRTDPGKAASARNNLRHGFRSQSVFLPGDDHAAYETLLAELTEHFGPQDLTEQRFIREMADAEWRLRRVRQALEDSLNTRMTSLWLDYPETPLGKLQNMALDTLGESGTTYGTWLRYESKFERQYETARRAWSRYQETRRAVSQAEADIWMKKTVFVPVPGTPPASTVDESQNASAQLRHLTDQAEKLASNVQNRESSAQDATRAAVVRGTTMPSNVQNPMGPSSAPADPPQTPRSAPCPCGSGEKYKRCCGINAPGVLSKAA